MFDEKSMKDNIDSHLHLGYSHLSKANGKVSLHKSKLDTTKNHKMKTSLGSSLPLKISFPDKIRMLKGENNSTSARDLVSDSRDKAFIAMMESPTRKRLNGPPSISRSDSKLSFYQYQGMDQELCKLMERRDSHLAQLKLVVARGKLLKSADKHIILKQLVAVRKISMQIVQKCNTALVTRLRPAEREECTNYLRQMATDLEFLNTGQYRSLVGVDTSLNPFLSTYKIDGSLALISIGSCKVETSYYSVPTELVLSSDDFDFCTVLGAVIWDLYSQNQTDTESQVVRSIMTSSSQPLFPQQSGGGDNKVTVANKITTPLALSQEPENDSKETAVVTPSRRKSMGSMFGGGKRESLCSSITPFGAPALSDIMASVAASVMAMDSPGHEASSDMSTTNVQFRKNFGNRDIDSNKFSRMHKRASMQPSTNLLITFGKPNGDGLGLITETSEQSTIAHTMDMITTLKKYFVQWRDLHHLILKEKKAKFASDFLISRRVFSYMASAVDWRGFDCMRAYHLRLLATVFDAWASQRHRRKSFGDGHESPDTKVGGDDNVNLGHSLESKEQNSTKLWLVVSYIEHKASNNFEVLDHAGSKNPYVTLSLTHNQVWRPRTSGRPHGGRNKSVWNIDSSDSRWRVQVTLAELLNETLHLDLYFGDKVIGSGEASLQPSAANGFTSSTRDYTVPLTDGEGIKGAGAVLVTLSLAC